MNQILLDDQGEMWMKCERTDPGATWFKRWGNVHKVFINGLQKVDALGGGAVYCPGATGHGPTAARMGLGKIVRDSWHFFKPSEYHFEPKEGVVIHVEKLARYPS